MANDGDGLSINRSVNQSRQSINQSSSRRGEKARKKGAAYDRCNTKAGSTRRHTPPPIRDTLTREKHPQPRAIPPARRSLADPLYQACPFVFSIIPSDRGETRHVHVGEICLTRPVCCLIGFYFLFFVVCRASRGGVCVGDG